MELVLTKLDPESSARVILDLLAKTAMAILMTVRRGRVLMVEPVLTELMLLPVNAQRDGKENIVKKVCQQKAMKFEPL